MKKLKDALSGAEADLLSSHPWSVAARVRVRRSAQLWPCVAPVKGHRQGRNRWYASSFCTLP